MSAMVFACICLVLIIVVTVISLVPYMSLARQLPSEKVCVLRKGVEKRKREIKHYVVIWLVFGIVLIAPTIASARYFAAVNTQAYYDQHQGSSVIGASWAYLGSCLFCILATIYILTILRAKLKALGRIEAD